MATEQLEQRTADVERRVSRIEQALPTLATERSAGGSAGGHLQLFEALVSSALFQMRCQMGLVQ